MILAATYRVELTFTEPVLGTVPMDQNLYKGFIERQKPEDQQEEESKSVENRESRGWTGFRREPDLYYKPGAKEEFTEDVTQALQQPGGIPSVAKRGRLFTYDYTIRGFLKESANALRQIEAHDVRGVKTKIDQFVFAQPRRIFFVAPPERWHKAGPVSLGGCGHIGNHELTPGMMCHFCHKADGVLERPLRAETPQGPRVALVRSDLLEVGTKLPFTLKVLWPKVFTEDLLRLCFERGEYLGYGQWRTGSYGRCTFTLTPDEGNAKLEADRKQVDAAKTIKAISTTAKRGRKPAQKNPSDVSSTPNDVG